MSKQSKNTIKSWFKNGTFPNQFHFWDWMDSFFHKDEQIPSGQIENLQNLLDSKVDKKDLPDGDVAITDVSGLNDALDIKVDKEDGKGLSTEDFTPVLKAKLDAVEKDANNYQHPLTHSASMIEETADKAFTSDAEKQANANHIDNVDIHKTSEEIRSEIVDVDIPVTIARQDDVAASADGVLSTIRGGVSETYDTLKKVYDWIFVHDGNTDIHKTSEQIRSEIVDEDIPVSLARVSQLTTENIVGSVCETLEEAQDKAYDGYTCYVKTDQKSYVFKLEEEIVLDEENNEVVNQKFIPHEIDTANQDCVASLGGLYDWNAEVNGGSAMNTFGTVDASLMKGKITRIAINSYSQMNFTNATAGDTGTIVVTSTSSFSQFLYFTLETDHNAVHVNTGVEVSKTTGSKRVYIPAYGLVTIEWIYDGSKLRIISRGLDSSGYIGDSEIIEHNISGVKTLDLRNGLSYYLMCKHSSNVAEFNPFYYSDNVIYTLRVINQSPDNSKMKIILNKATFSGGEDHFYLDYGSRAAIQFFMGGGSAWITGFSNTSAVEPGGALSASSTYLPPEISLTTDTPLISKTPQTVTLSINAWGNLKTLSKVEVLDPDSGAIYTNESITNNHLTATASVTGLEAFDGARTYTLKVTYSDDSFETKTLDLESVNNFYAGGLVVSSSTFWTYPNYHGVTYLVPLATKEYSFTSTYLDVWGNASMQICMPATREIDYIIMDGVRTKHTVNDVTSTSTTYPGMMWNKLDRNLENEDNPGVTVNYKLYDTHGAGFYIGRNQHASVDITIKFK
ncbi:hypothetical protein L3073_17640 [Ancylomarina sp. DW003]|nr:hypothetical protein [Ancylomarina sp. DW003]MDE5424042.1 hypothetical protein [Ancylomarina sp. DW003]